MSTITTEIPDPLLKSIQQMAKSEGVAVERLAALAIAQAVGAWGIQRSDFEARAMRGNREKFERVLAKVPDVEPEHEWDRIPQKSFT
jgi:hypothetical protein